eukprot:gene17907-biopygen8367
MEVEEIRTLRRSEEDAPCTRGHNSRFFCFAGRPPRVEEDGLSLSRSRLATSVSGQYCPVGCFPTLWWYVHNPVAR